MPVTFKSIIITDRFSLIQETRLRSQLTPDMGFLVERLDTLTKQDQISKASALVIRTKTKINQQFLESSKNLKFIVSVTSGFDHIDLESTRARDIVVRYTPEGNANSAAEMTFALALACARHLPSADVAVRKGNWDREKLRGVELFGKTWGIIGFGRIGRLVATRARAFGMTVCAFDPYVDDEVFAALGVERHSLIEVQRASDILSLHVPLTHETHHMISLQTLENFEEGAILVNASRGEVIKERDLLEALDRGYLAGAALDVFEQEPLSLNSSLLKHPRIVVSPHCGANTTEAFERGCEAAVDRILEFFDSNHVPTSVGDPSQEPWFKGDRHSCN